MRALSKLAAVAVLGMAMTAGAVAADVVDDRKKGFKAHGDNIKAVSAAVKAGNAADAVAPATKMVAFAGTIEGLFPEGSNQGETRALPKIWSDWAGFQKVTNDHIAATKALLAAAESGDVAATGAALKATGASCGACHKPYRAEKK
jgi:cytochrome c556